QRQLAEDKQRLMHCDLQVFGGNLMLSDEFPEMGNADTQSPVTRGGASVTIHVNLPKAGDIDRVMNAAANAGARITMPAADMFWGARYGRMLDPFGHSWSFGAPANQPAEVRTPARQSATRKRTATAAKPAAKAPAKVNAKSAAKAKPNAKPNAKARTSRSGRR